MTKISNVLTKFQYMSLLFSIIVTSMKGISRHCSLLSPQIVLRHTLEMLRQSSTTSSCNCHNISLWCRNIISTPCIVSIMMVGHDNVNFVATIVLELLSAFFVIKGITIATYFQSSSFYFIATIIFYVATFFPVLHFILCCDITIDVATMFCSHLPCSLA